MLRAYLIAFLLACLMSAALSFSLGVSKSYAQESYAEESYAGENDEQTVATSPKAPWGEFEAEEEEESNWGSKVLLWLPNRLVDLYDVFRVDVGVGPSVGAVLRVSEHAQAGYRHVFPFSARLGTFGRSAPFIIESSDEYGVSPTYVSSDDRDVGELELGVGLDVVIVGAYAGVRFEELADFVAGIFFIDLKDDDF